MSDFDSNDFYSNAFQQISDPKQTTESFTGSARQAEQTSMLDSGGDSDMVDARSLKENPQNRGAAQSSYRAISTSSSWVGRSPQPALFGSRGPNEMNFFQYQPASTHQAISDSNANMMFTTSDAMQMQQQPSPSDLFGLDTRFNPVDSSFDPSPFTSPLDPMGAFPFGAAPDFPTTGDMSMDFDTAASAQFSESLQTQAMNNFLTNQSYAPQFSMQGSNDVVGQDDWLGAPSGFDLGGPISNTQQQLSQGLEESAYGAQMRNPQIHRPLPIVSVNRQQAPQNNNNSNSNSNNPGAYTSSFIPAELAPVTEPGTGTGKVASQFLNVYSSSGFDMFGILARVATRPNPEIEIGAVDMSCAFILCDVTAHDDPIVYVSDAFEKLTGYTRHEILGRNCRFLQAPDGKVDPGLRRKYVDDKTVYQLKTKIKSRSEVQVSMINYRKGGQPFMNLLTMIPISWNSDDFKFYVGFQVDLVEKPQAVTKRNSDGSYTINYQRDHLPRYVLHAPEPRRVQVGGPKSISHDEVSAVLRSIGIGGPEISKRFLDRVLLENADDVVHVLSLKGLFLYLSPSSQRVLEYDAGELVGTAVTSVCHPSDIAPVTRELKQSTAGSPVSIVYRVRRKKSGYMWFESHGALHVEPGKGRKCLILVGRERPVYALDRAAIAESGGIGENDLWTKMSISGMFLFVSSNARGLLDRHPDEMIGKSLQEFMRSESRGELGKALEVARTGRQATFKHELRHKRGHVLQAQTTLFPGDANPGSKPSFLIAQTRLLKSSRSAYTPQRTPIIISSTDNMSSGLGSPPTLSSSTSGGLQSQGKGPGTPLYTQHYDVTTEAGSYGLPLGNQDEALLSEDNIFEELRSTRSSSWQFELRQLERRNRSLAEELQGLLSRRKKRKRKKGTGPLEKACANCQTRNTPEWRRGPSGNRDLCNSCGLRWAKQNGRISPRKGSEASDRSPSSARLSPRSSLDERIGLEPIDESTEPARVDEQKNMSKPVTAGT